MGKYNFRATIRANESNHALWLSRLLERGWNCFVEAVATQLMRGLQIADKAVLYVSENALSYFTARIALFFGRPILKAHTFLFEFVYFRRQRRLLALSRKNLLLCGDDYLLKLDDLAVELIKVSKLQHRLGDGAGCTKT